MVDSWVVSKVGMTADPLAASTAGLRAHQTADWKVAPKAAEMDPRWVDRWAACWVGKMVEPWAAQRVDLKAGQMVEPWAAATADGKDRRLVDVLVGWKDHMMAGTKAV